MPTYVEWVEKLKAIKVGAFHLRTQLEAVVSREAQLEAQVNEDKGKLSAIVRSVEKGRLAHFLKQLKSNDMTPNQQEVIEKQLNSTIKVLKKDMDKIALFLEKASTPDFQAEQEEVVIQAEITKLFDSYQALSEKIEVVETPKRRLLLDRVTSQMRDRVTSQDRDLKKAYDAMQDAAIQLKADYREGIVQFREAAHLPGIDKFTAYTSVCVPLERVYEAYVEAKSVYEKIIEARQETLREALQPLSTQIEVFEAGVKDSEVLFNQLEKASYKKQVSALRKKADALKTHTSVAGDRKALDDCSTEMKRLEKEIRVADEALQKAIAKKLPAAQKDLERKKGIYLEQIQAKEGAANFETRLQEITIPDISKHTVHEAVALLNTVELKWKAVVQECLEASVEASEEEVQRTSSMHADDISSGDGPDDEPSFLKDIASALYSQIQPSGVLLKRIETYNNKLRRSGFIQSTEPSELTEEQMNALINTDEKMNAMKALLDGADDHQNPDIALALKAYMPTILTFFKRDEDVLSLLCKMHDHADEQFKAYVDTKDLLPRFLMLFAGDTHAGKSILRKEIETLKSLLLSDKSDAYQMIMASFLYNGHPLMSTDTFNFEKYEHVALFTLMTKLGTKGVLDKLADYPKDKVDGLGHTMFAFSKAFDGELKNNPTPKLRTKLHQTQFEVFKALVSHPQGTEGIAAAEQIIADKLEVGVGQRLRQYFLSFFEWGRRTATYRYVENKIQSRAALFQKVKSVFEEGEDVFDKKTGRESPTSVMDPFKHGRDGA